MRPALSAQDEEPELPTRTLARGASDLAAGALVSGRYEILGSLGRGGMGSVYGALDREINEEVALKVLDPETTGDPSAVERFRNELKLARKIVHKNVCRLYHFGEDRGTYYLVMERVAGEDLKSRLRREGRISPDAALALARQISEGLAEAHRLGIVHRDLKPGNIMIDRDGDARIMDFGIARSLHAPGITSAGGLVGTPGYMSPEQLEGREADARSDIYSLGAMLFEMVTGRPPFEGGAAPAAAGKRRVVEPPDPLSIDPGLPSGLSRIILKCLAREREERYPTAAELAADLDAVSSGGPGPAAPAGNRGRRMRRLAFLTAVGVVLLGAVLCVFLSREGRTAPSIAVLPLQNLSGDPDEDYFAAGITEDIIAQLSKIGELKVISRTSVWKYRTGPKSIPEIGRELGVGAILEGSVRREGGRVRIVGQLIDARTDRHLWAETYDRPAGDIFAIQAEVAGKIAGELRVKLSPAEKKRLARAATASVDAYALYVRGRELYYRYAAEDNEKAIELYRDALDLDPSYALAYAGLADAYAMRALSFGRASDELETAREMSRKALALDPELAEGHKALGLALESLGDEEGGLRAYYRAFELNPNYAPVASNIGSIHFTHGRYDEAARWLKRAVELQPGVARFYALLALQFFTLGDDAAAEAWLKRAVEFQPASAFPRLIAAYIDLFAGRLEEARQSVAELLAADPGDANALDAAGDVALIAGDWAEARRHFGRLVELTSWKGWPANKLAFAEIKLGREDEAEALLLKNVEYCLGAEGIDREGSPVRYYLAEAYSLLGRKTEALDALEKAEANGYYERWRTVDPLLEGLRGEPRFAEIVERSLERIAAMRRRAARPD